jgi:hypothetical protein
MPGLEASNSPATFTVLSDLWSSSVAETTWMVVDDFPGTTGSMSCTAPLNQPEIVIRVQLHYGKVAPTCAGEVRFLNLCNQAAIPMISRPVSSSVRLDASGVETLGVPLNWK